MSTNWMKISALALAILGLGVGGIAATSMGPLNGPTETIVAPHRLNLESNGNFVTAILKNVTELPGDLNASDLTATASLSIGGSDVSVNATVRAYGGDNHTVVVKIDRQAISAAIADALGTGGSVDDPITVTVTVSGGGASVTRSGVLDWFSPP